MAPFHERSTTFQMELPLNTKIKKTFINLCFHEADFGVPAEWHFSATSHGKGACDGVGGTVKDRLQELASSDHMKSR